LQENKLTAHCCICWSFHRIEELVFLLYSYVCLYIYFKEVLYQILKIRRKLKVRLDLKIFMYSKQQSIANVRTTTAQTASRPITCICGVRRHQRTSRVRTVIVIIPKYLAPLPSYVVHFMKRTSVRSLIFRKSNTSTR